MTDAIRAQLYGYNIHGRIYAAIFETTTPFGFTLSFLQGVLFKIANNAILLADVTASVKS